MEVVVSLSQGRTTAAQCGLFTHKSIPVIFEPPCNINGRYFKYMLQLNTSSFFCRVDARIVQCRPAGVIKTTAR